MRISIATLVMLVGAGAGVSVPAMATTSVLGHQHENMRQIVVHYGDLNVDTAQGAEQLYRRISIAADRVCIDDGDPLYVELGSAYHRCRQATVVKAVAQVDRPKVTALYDQHFPHNPLVGASSASDGGSHHTVG